MHVIVYIDNMSHLQRKIQTTLQRADETQAERKVCCNIDDFKMVAHLLPQHPKILYVAYLSTSSD